MNDFLRLERSNCHNELGREEICQNTRALLSVSDYPADDKSIKKNLARLFDEHTPEKAFKSIVELEDGTLKGETQLFKNTRWAKDFVHSSDLMPCVGILAQRLGGENEISRIKKFRIHRRIKKQMTLYAKKSDSLDGLIQKEEKDVSLTMELKTKNGVIVMAGFQREDSSPLESFDNIILSEITRNFQSYSVAHDSIQFPVSPFSLSNENKDLALKMPLGLRLAISIDLILSAIRLIPLEIMLRVSADSSRIGLVGGFEDFTLPETPALLGGGMITIKMPPLSKIKNTKTNLLIIPIDFEFYDKQGKILGGGIVNMAMPKSK